MQAFGRASLLAATFTVALAAGAQAQKCDIEEGKPYQLASAKQYLAIVNDPAKKAGERPNHLRNTIRVLTEKADRIGNPAGRNFLLAKALYAWTQKPTLQGNSLGWSPTEVGRTVARRGDLGYTENPNGQIDVILAIDSALTQVETLQPACVSETERIRRSLWAPLVNTAIETLREDRPDSAAALAQLSLVIFDESPHAHNVLAQVAQQKNDIPAMSRQLRTMIEKAGTDTAFAKLRVGALNQLAVAATIQAEELEGAEREAKLREAADLFRQYLAVQPDDPNAKAGLARVLQASGDTAAVTQIFNEMLASPDKYTSLQLFEAGVAAARAERHDEAAQLFEHGLGQNRYYRDALFNLANVHLANKNYEKMMPVVRRLIEVDPGNPDNWRLLAGAYQGQARAQKDAKRRRALNDSLLKYLEMSEKMPVRVSFSRFQHSGATHTLSGNVENRGTAARTFNLKFEFLDTQGNVVATKETTVGPVAPKETKQFSVEVQQSGIAAFRYAPLDTGA